LVQLDAVAGLGQLARKDHRDSLVPQGGLVLLDLKDAMDQLAEQVGH
jgi:hypothetical protein